MQQADFTIMKDTIEEEEESQSQSDSIFDKKRATATTTYSWLTQEEEEEPAAIKSSSSSCSSSCSLQPKQRRETISDIFQSKKRLFSNLHEKNKLSSFVSDELESTRHWDPHIDAFEILRAKITGITRSMQDFHVQELIQDELVAEERRKRLSVFPTTTISTPLQNNNSNKATSRRFSLATPKNEEKRFLNEDDKASISSDEEEEEERLPISSNITALFLTTNNLINSRLNELSETITSSNKSEQLKWQKQFLNLVTSCIHQSEALESLSTEILNAEHRVRELLLVKDSLHEQFQEREKQYEERIRECQEIAHQQLVMIDSLEELNADIDMKLETNRRELHRQEALNALDGRRGQEEEQEDQRWDFNKSVASLLHMEEKQDIIHKMRWEIGMFVGGGVGTGHIIHTVENELNGIDMMIAGTGSTSTSPNDHFETTISSNIQHIGLYQHKYIIHLNHQDRRTRFILLPRSLWVPDEAAQQCQFYTKKSRCTTQFTLFNRRHHCRKCGMVVCQRHSANRLPLFHPSKIYSTTGQWSRVCDRCFYDLIIIPK